MNNTIVIIGVVVIAAIIIISLFSRTKKESSNKVMDINVTEFKQQKESQSGIIIDVRSQEEYDEGHLAETDRHHDLMNGDFEAQLDSLDKDETYYLYCRSGNRSGKAASLMTQRGFENVYNIGGFQDLVDAGLKAER